MRSPLTETIYRVQGMISYVRENLSTDEYMLYLDLLVPEPEPIAKVAKKARKKRATKSAHQQSLSSAIRRVPKGKAEDYEDERCTVLRGDLGGTACGLLLDHNVHQMSSARGYHPFVSASDAGSAGEKSSANGAASSTTANTVAETGNVSVAVVGVGARD